MRGLPFRLMVPGDARPAGSKTAIPYIGADGAQHVRVFDDSDRKGADGKGGKGKRWRGVVQAIARASWNGDGLLVCPLRLTLVFVRPRLKGHMGSGRNAGRVKDSAPFLCSVTPDATKLLRALEDALTGVLWTNDALIVEQRVGKVYGPRPGAYLLVEEADGSTERWAREFVSEFAER